MSGSISNEASFGFQDEDTANKGWEQSLIDQVIRNFYAC